MEQIKYNRVLKSLGVNDQDLSMPPWVIPIVAHTPLLHESRGLLKCPNTGVKKFINKYPSMNRMKVIIFETCSNTR